MIFSKVARHFAVEKSTCAAGNQNEDGLFLLHIITRHGDRTAKTTFPKDEYKNEKFYPVGHGRLTNLGKKRIYDNGLFLKERYQNFLGNIYIPHQVEVRASEYDRTQMTAQILMAAMYPPKAGQMWHPKLSWQPIPIKSTHRENDLLFLPEYSCKKFMDLQIKNVEGQMEQGKFEEFGPLFRCLQKCTGMNVTVPGQVTKLHDTLKCQKEWGLKLPSWAYYLYPEEMEKAVEHYWNSYANSDDLKRLGAGFLLKKIVDDTTNKINGAEPNKEMKLHVYSGHDSCIVSMLQLLGVFDGHIVNYGAYILIEIHKLGNDYVVKVYYHNDQQIEPHIMHLNKSTNPYGFDEFVNNYKKYFGEPNMC